MGFAHRCYIPPLRGLISHYPYFEHNSVVFSSPTCRWQSFGLTGGDWEGVFSSIIDIMRMDFAHHWGIAPCWKLHCKVQIQMQIERQFLEFIQSGIYSLNFVWMPAFAGMTSGKMKAKLYQLLKLGFGFYKDFPGFGAVEGSDNIGIFKLINYARSAGIANF